MSLARLEYVVHKNKLLLLDQSAPFRSPATQIGKSAKARTPYSRKYLPEFMSEAFFYSKEFLNTKYLTERMRKMCYIRTSGFP